MVNSFFCFIISFFPFSLLFDYIYGTFAMETFPLCLLFRIRRHHLRHRCDKKKTTTRIWYKTIFVKKGDQLTPGIYTKSVFVCLFAPVSDDDFAFSFHPRRRIKSVFYCYSLFIYYFLLLDWAQHTHIVPHRSKRFVWIWKLVGFLIFFNLISVRCLKYQRRPPVPLYTIAHCQFNNGLEETIQNRI